MTIPATESPSALHPELDTYSSERLVEAFLSDQKNALDAVQAAIPALTRAVAAAVPRLQRGGRLIYIGAGTSGRLGALDAAELMPTFSWPPERALGVLAGGPAALTAAIEGAEDNAEQAVYDLSALALTAQDVVILISASGRAPYVISAAQVARAAGALTIALTNNSGAPLVGHADIAVELLTGPELISGSTRLKAGTAQKVALNTFSSSCMVQLGKVYGNLMVDLRATNDKLRRRALALVQLASGADEPMAQTALQAAEGQVKTAILMLRSGIDAPTARQRLQAVDGFLRKALGA